MFGTLGGPELFLIFVVALIVFGPRKLPEIGKSLGRMVGEFRKASTEFRRTLEDEVEADKARVLSPASVSAPGPVSPVTTPIPPAPPSVPVPAPASVSVSETPSRPLETAPPADTVSRQGAPGAAPDPAETPSS